MKTAFPHKTHTHSYTHIWCSEAEETV